MVEWHGMIPIRELPTQQAISSTAIVTKRDDVGCSNLRDCDSGYLETRYVVNPYFRAKFFEMLSVYTYER